MLKVKENQKNQHYLEFVVKLIIGFQTERLLYARPGGSNSNFFRSYSFYIVSRFSAKKEDFFHFKLEFSLPNSFAYSTKFQLFKLQNHLGEKKHFIFFNIKRSKIYFSSGRFNSWKRHGRAKEKQKSKKRQKMF